MTWAGIKFFAKRVWYFFVDNWQLPAVLTGIFVLAMFTGLAYRGCMRSANTCNTSTLKPLNGVKLIPDGKHTRNNR